MNSNAVSMDQVPVKATTAQRAAASGHDVVVLPLRQIDGLGVYSESSVMLVRI